MILKYKLKNGNWRFITLNDFTYGKLDIIDFYNSHLNSETGKIKISADYCSGDDAFFELQNLFTRNAFYEIKFGDVYDIVHDDAINKYMTYLIISYNDDKTLILYNETYLMSDEGKTIEKLL